MEAFGQFPTLHPLVVHVPVVLIPLAPLFFLAAWRGAGRALDWAGLALLAAGWAGAVLASNAFHPHVDAMPLLAQEVLESHELWADWTQGLAGAAVLAAAALCFLRPSRLRKGARIAVLILSLAAAACVAAAGHQGAVLTHVYRVEVTP